MKATHMDTVSPQKHVVGEKKKRNNKQQVAVLTLYEKAEYLWNNKWIYWEQSDTESICGEIWWQTEM